MNIYQNNFDANKALIFRDNKIFQIDKPLFFKSFWNFWTVYVKNGENLVNISNLVQSQLKDLSKQNLKLSADQNKKIKANLIILNNKIQEYNKSLISRIFGWKLKPVENEILVKEEREMANWTNGIKVYATGNNAQTHLLLDNLLVFMKQLSNDSKEQLFALVKNNFEIKQEPILFMARKNKLFNFTIKNPDIQPEGIEISPVIREFFKQICEHRLSDLIEYICCYGSKEKHANNVKE